jgi:hypothetical protein
MRQYSYFSPLICGIILLFLIAPIFQVKTNYLYHPIGNAYGYQLLMGGSFKADVSAGKSPLLALINYDSQEQRVPSLVVAFGLVFLAVTGIGIYFIRAKLALQVVYLLLFVLMFGCVLLMRHEYMEVKDSMHWVEVRWPWYLLMVLTVSGTIWSIYRSLFELNIKEIENPTYDWQIPLKIEYEGKSGGGDEN